jgi:hypothetical protein
MKTRRIYVGEVDGLEVLERRRGGHVRFKVVLPRFYNHNENYGTEEVFGILGLS